MDGKTPEVAVDFKSSSSATPFYEKSEDGKGQTLTLSGKSDGLEELITAYIKNGDKETELGYLNVKSYAETVRELVIIPVMITGGASPFTPTAIDTALVRKTLNEIYSQAVIKWQVELAEPFSIDRSDYDSDNDGKIDCGTGLFNTFTEEADAIKDAYRKGKGYLMRKHYLFLVDEAKQNVSGYMPLGGKQGFIFMNSAGNNLIRTIAHELGHGAFTLRHTFSEDPGIPEDTTQNLMDYGSGTELWKYQWDWMHDPVNLVLETDDDEEAYTASDYISKVFRMPSGMNIFESR